MFIEKKIVAIFKIIIKHKKKILFSILFFGFIAGIFAYFQTNMYKATTTVEIELNSIPRITHDNLETDVSQSQSNIDTEIELIQSRTLISKALERIDLAHRYYKMNSFKEKELYKDSPFEVEMSKGENLSFSIKHISKQFYHLEAAGTNKITGESWEFNKKYTYGKPVKNKYFSFTLFLKKGKILEKNVDYRFKILDRRSIIDMVSKNLSVTKKIKNSTILHVHYMDNVPLRAMEFINVLTQLYIEKGIEKKALESTLILDFIDKQIENIDNELMNSEKNLKTFKEKNNIPHIQKSNTLTKGENYKEKLAALSEEENMLRKLYEQLSKGKNFNNISTIGLNLSTTNIPQLFAQLQDSLFKRKELRVSYTMAHPRVRKLTEFIKYTKKRIITTVEALKSNISKRKQLLIKTIKEYDTLMKELPEKETVLVGLKHKLIVNEEIYSYVMKKRASTAIAKASMVNKNSILDSATKPLHYVSPNRLNIVILGALLGLFWGLLLTFISEFIDDRIKDEEDIRKRSDLPLLGTIPHMSNENGTIKVFESPKSVVSESFRALRTNLQFVHKKEDALVISITSTIGGEGKSTISSNLGAILSLTGKKVIILNMDMRKPTLHNKFSLKNTMGMSNLLAGHASLKDVIQETTYDNISIISSGPVPPNPSELIKEEIMHKLITVLTSNYDVIIFDTPPVGLVTDATTLMKLSNITLFVLRANYSKKVFLEDISRMKEVHNIEGLSLLLNGTKTHKHGYGYYEEGK